MQCTDSGSRVLKIGHMGDVGNPLSETQIEFFKGVNILLVLTGGPPNY